MYTYRVKLSIYFKDELIENKTLFIDSVDPCDAQKKAILDSSNVIKKHIEQIPVIGGFEYEAKIRHFTFRTHGIKKATWSEAY